jgi:hypothetical protein
MVMSWSKTRSGTAVGSFSPTIGSTAPARWNVAQPA